MLHAIVVDTVVLIDTTVVVTITGYITTPRLSLNFSYYCISIVMVRSLILHVRSTPALIKVCNSSSTLHILYTDSRSTAIEFCFTVFYSTNSSTSHPHNHQYRIQMLFYHNHVQEILSILQSCLPFPALAPPPQTPRYITLYECTLDPGG